MCSPKAIQICALPPDLDGSKEVKLTPCSTRSSSGEALASCTSGPLVDMMLSGCPSLQKEALEAFAVLARRTPKSAAAVFTTEQTRDELARLLTSSCMELAYLAALLAGRLHVHAGISGLPVAVSMIRAD